MKTCRVWIIQAILLVGDICYAELCAAGDDTCAQTSLLQTSLTLTTQSEERGLRVRESAQDNLVVVVKPTTAKQTEMVEEKSDEDKSRGQDVVNADEKAVKKSHENKDEKNNAENKEARSKNNDTEGEETMLFLKNKMVNLTDYGMDQLSHATYKERVGMALTSWLIYVILALMIWACCYPGPPVPAATPADIEDPIVTFNNGHWSCFSSPGICLCAFLCPGLRWADTMSLVGFLQITTGLTLAFLSAFLNGFVYTTAIAGPFTVLLALYYRQKLRQEFKLTSWTCSNLCCDALYLILCSPCALAQEARVVTHALQRGELKS